MYTRIFISVAFVAQAVAAQQPAPAPLAALVAEARARNPDIQASLRVADAAAAQLPRAGALPDPTLSLGVMNLPARDLRLRGNDMALATVQLSQMLPPAGVRAARTAAARANLGAAAAAAANLEIDVLARLTQAYYELYFADRAIEILTRNHAVVEQFAEVARGRYSVGRAPQQGALRAQTEVSRLEEQRSGAHAQRSGALAAVNAIRDRDPLTPLAAELPDAVAALARARPERGAFTLAAVDGGLGGALPTLPELQALAAQDHPALRMRREQVERASAELRAAERERMPDVELALGYGTQGVAGSDRVSAMVAVPLPVFAARKQRQAVVQGRAELDAAEAEYRGAAAAVASEIAAAYADVIRHREQILLLEQGVIPQASATIRSATAAYQTGAVDFLSLLDAQATLFRNEMELARQLADFGRAIARLERAAGRTLIGE